MEVIKATSTLLLLILVQPEDDRFNCPLPLGNVTFTDSWSAGLPMHIDRLLPPILELDATCRVNSSGRFVDCEQSPRQQLSERQTALVSGIFQRMMRSLRTDVRDQRCVAFKIKWDFAGDFPSIPAPDETAG